MPQGMVFHELPPLRKLQAVPYCTIFITIHSRWYVEQFPAARTDVVV
jgi:hypothetical protein